MKRGELTKRFIMISNGKKPLWFPWLIHKNSAQTPYSLDTWCIFHTFPKRLYFLHYQTKKLTERH